MTVNRFVRSPSKSSALEIYRSFEKMDSSEEEEIALLSVILFDNKNKRKQAKTRRFWVREIFQRREEHGVFSLHSILIIDHTVNINLDYLKKTVHNLFTRNEQEGVL